MNILHLTTILPAPLKRKWDENDILIRIALEYQDRYPSDNHFFVLCVPYSNFVLSLIKKKWQEYFKLIKKGFYNYKGFKIYVVGIPAFKRDMIIKKQLTVLGYRINRGQIKKIIDDVKPDIVHAHNLGANTELAQIINTYYKIPFLSSARDIRPSIINRIKQEKITPQKILFINQFIFNCYNKDVNLPIEVIPHPVDDDFYLDKIQPIDNSTVKFVSVGRLIGLKNIDKVIIALSNLTVDYSYDIYGDGSEKEYLEKLVLSLGMENKVKFHGRVEHSIIKNELHKYDLFLQPSYPETLGRVYLEAMAAAVPVLASRCTGIDGLIEEGEQGFLVDPKNIDSIKNAINKFTQLNNEEQLRMRLKSARLASKYKWNNTLERYYELYHSNCQMGTTI